MSDPSSASERSASESPVILGISLKLYLDIAQTTQWALDVAAIARAHAAVKSGAVRLFALPSLPALPAVREALTDSEVAWGAQDLHWEDRGAFTGAISGADLAAVGCSVVEVGHAERRHVFGESDDMIWRKLAAAFRNGLTPVFCVGEQEEMSADAAGAECIAQLEAALASAVAHADVDQHGFVGELIVAYEPEWAIGRAQPASVEHVIAVVGALRARLASESSLRSSSVIYGGSAQRGTLAALGNSVDGLFLGRFAHDPEDLAHIIDEAAALR
ncbi:triose-phosphate isomerase family protein [Microbacterium sp. A93]|uniref:triose-phosphate isomerase family protein n=1 Tax=Microbacterium sp. A93 TaxID=3450716 RepID=UPI003F43C233